MVGACHVLQQIQENEQERLLALEREEQEQALARQKMVEMMKDELAKRADKRSKQEILRAELNEANNLIMERRKRENQLEILNDMKILEIQKLKAVSSIRLSIFAAVMSSNNDFFSLFV
ncbi:unnamed protein product [Protopolystoma xenopodis]|uniref:Trichohyalin-plectin-homology domain-containing protein n=1 Tax=Protopolystoma xenopodis TaxID=117903 RepID=A0A3S5BFQ8_9PLAT|nr:unnamed protein product [Protopolystoma xenopodis]